jgi:hypothetical protein
MEIDHRRDLNFEHGHNPSAKQRRLETKVCQWSNFPLLQEWQQVSFHGALESEITGILSFAPNLSPHALAKNIH